MGIADPCPQAAVTVGWGNWPGVVGQFTRWVNGGQPQCSGKSFSDKGLRLVPVLARRVLHWSQARAFAPAPTNPESTMNRPTLARLALALFTASLGSSFVATDAMARNLSYSAGKGVKCYYVLVSSQNGNNVYQTVCRKSGV
jgi:hypothetical protein